MTVRNWIVSTCGFILTRPEVIRRSGVIFRAAISLLVVGRAFGYAASSRLIATQKLYAIYVNLLSAGLIALCGTATSSVHAEVIKMEWAGQIETFKDSGVTCYLYRGRNVRNGIDCKGRPTQFSMQTFETKLGWVERADVGSSVCYVYANIRVIKGSMSCVEKNPPAGG